jgi:hypothetical protein
LHVGSFAICLRSYVIAIKRLKKLEVTMRVLGLGELELVYGGGDECDCSCPPEEPEKGNNGWGNGADPSNAGSDNGGTAPSKSANASVPSAGKINTNPTDSDGR